MEKSKVKYWILISLVLLLFGSNAPVVGSISTQPFENNLPSGESPFYDEMNVGTAGYEAPRTESTGLGNGFSPFAIGGGGTEDGFETGAGNDNTNAYNDVPVGDGTYLLLSMVFAYAIRRKLIRNRKLKKMI